MLKAEEITKSFKSLHVVKGVSFNVNAGEVVGLLGPNGAGKTTSFYMVVGLISPNSGRIILQDKDITALSMSERARLGIGYLPQNKSIFQQLTVEQNLMAVAEIARIPKHLREEKVETLLGRFHVEHKRKALGASLSGGERRRVEIARSLIINPKFLLLDEPFAGIDPVTVQEIQKIILDLKKDGLGVLITDHNVRETLSTCDRAYILSKGSLIEEGKPEQILASSKVRQIYLGEDFKY